jgi:hypothetical protein
MLARTKWLRGLSVAAIAAVALTACEDTVVNVPPQPEPPPPPITITITPAQLDLVVGQTQQVVATVSGGAAGTSRGVTFSSSNSQVATVNAQGVVTAVAPGTATIIAEAQADASVRAGTGVTVRSAELPPTPPGEDAEVTIQSVTNVATNVPVNPNNVTGQIDVTLGVTRGPADRLEVLLNGIPVPGCVQTFGSASEPAALTADNMTLNQQSSIVCSINTAEFDVVDGQGNVTWPNATYSLSARLLRSGEVLDSATGADLRFRNVDFVALTVNAEDQAFSAGDLLWHGGDVTVTGIPVSYTGLDIVRVTFQARDAGAAVSTRTATSAPFTVTFPAAANPGGTTQGLNNVETANFSIRATTVTAAGQEGPTTITSQPVNRYDARDPDAGTLVLQEQRLDAYPLRLCCSNNWVGADYGFMAGKAGHADGGVGIQDIRFFVGAPTQTNAAIIAAGNEITSGADLAETATNQAYKVVAVVRDRLGNQSNVALSGIGVNPNATLGVDKTAPRIDVLGPAQGAAPNMAVNPAASWQVAIADTATGGAAPSGFGVDPVLTKLVRYYPAGNLGAAARCPIGSPHPTTGVCREIGHTTVVPIPGDQGYYEYESYVVDQAGNRSAATITRIGLRDNIAPTAGNVVMPATLTGGSTATFSLAVEDDLNLWRHQFRQLFADASAIPFAGFTAINERWPELPGGLMRTGTAQASHPFVRMIQDTDANGVPTAMHAATGVRFLVQDAAANPVTREGVFAAVPAGTSFAARGLNEFEIASPASGAEICRGANCAGAPTTRTIRVEARGATGTFVNPFTTLHLYGGSQTEPTWRASTTSASVTDDGTTRTWFWTFQVSGATTAGSIVLWVGGVHAQGDMLRSMPITLNVVGDLP